MRVRHVELVKKHFKAQKPWEIKRIKKYDMYQHEDAQGRPRTIQQLSNHHYAYHGQAIQLEKFEDAECEEVHSQFRNEIQRKNRFKALRPGRQAKMQFGDFVPDGLGRLIYSGVSGAYILDAQFSFGQATGSGRWLWNNGRVLKGNFQKFVLVDDD